MRTCYAPPSPAFLDACDELGLLVFPEMPGWQHIGDEVWQAQALQNCREMVCQYRSHPSIFCGVPASAAAPTTKPFISAPTKPSTGWTPPALRRAAAAPAKSQLLEDVYAYNDYSYAGRGAGCENRAAVTPRHPQGLPYQRVRRTELPRQAL